MASLMPRPSDQPHTILVYHPAEAQRYASLIRKPRGVRLHVAQDEDGARRAIADADIVYAWKLPPGLYREAARLRWLQAMGAGVDWVLGHSLPSGVMLTRAPGIFGPWMAEYVLGWCLWVTQRIGTYLDAKADRRWVQTVLPDRLRDKTLLLVGVGDIGRTVARAARALGARIEGVNTTGRALPGVDRMYPVRQLRVALGRADFVVLLVPLTPSTRGLIGAGELAAMKRSAWLINIARGAVTQEAALVAALETGRIAGAVLDVFETEPLPADHALWKLPNAMVTPHISGPSTAEEIAPIFNDNLRRFLAGRPLRHRVDLAKGY
jgi:phosphoglycerate dehydrogenase-like enzyme